MMNKMKIVTIVSGKGGVGKSSITASLGITLSKKYKIIMADCDVDASNLALVFGKKEKDFMEWKDISTNQKAVFDLDKCNSCKKCYNACNFNAIDWVNNKPKLKNLSCEGCGIADVICPQGAIKLEDVYNAKIGYVNTKYNFNIVSSQLNIGESGSGKLVDEVKNKARELAQDSEIMLVDSAAGIGCPVIASITGSNYCVVVVEPTPSSIFDMKRILEIVKYFNIPFGIIINKFDLDEKYYKKIKKLAEDNCVEVLGKISYDKIFVKSLVNMIPVVEVSSIYKELFDNISDKLIRIL